MIQEQAQNDTTPYCVKSFFSELRVLKRNRCTSFYLLCFLTVALPFELAAELYRISQLFTGVKVYETFPEECLFSDPEKNCLRVELEKSKCIGAVRTDLPVLFENKSLRQVGKAITKCISGINLTQIKIKKI